MKCFFMDVRRILLNAVKREDNPCLFCQHKSNENLIFAFDRIQLIKNEYKKMSNIYSFLWL